MKTRSRWLVALLAAAVILAACGGDEGGGSDTTDGGDGTAAPVECESTDQVRLQLQWVAQSQFAGYFVAKDLGFYEEQCLEVEILEGAVEIVPQTVLASGGAEFGLAWVPKALVSRNEGADIINIAQVFERSGTLMVSFADQGITSVADFAGKQVGNWGFGNEYELTAAIEQEGIADQVELVAQSFDMLALLNGDIDVAEAMIYNEYAQVLEAENPDTGELYQPEDLNVIDFNDVGTAMLQDAVWVNADWIADEANADIAERFLYASFKGWSHCLENFDECVQIVLDNGSTLGASHQAWQLNEILGLIFPATNGIGVMNEDLWNQTVEISTSQIPELEGVEITADAFRTDIATAAVERLEADGIDVSGEGYEPQTIELQPGGE
ncbi:MAG TPA: ABC transporter substrate-binding protein [Acidimicrobiia bacterium]|nr:ABC transporter substrate-binding protein [Acidimicrobiia bacterium]